MKYLPLSKSDSGQLTALFRSVFTASEGEREGALLAKLVAELSAMIDDESVICFGAAAQGALLGAIFFSRLQFIDPISVYMLAPVAVSHAHQGRGIGQALINYGLSELKKRDVAVVVTYGDPAFYGRVGFSPLSEATIQAPLTMSMPHGWQGQSLTDEPLPVMFDRPTCVAPFNDPIYW